MLLSWSTNVFWMLYVPILWLYTYNIYITCTHGLCIPLYTRAVDYSISVHWELASAACVTLRLSTSTILPLYLQLHRYGQAMNAMHPFGISNAPPLQSPHPGYQHDPTWRGQGISQGNLRRWLDMVQPTSPWGSSSTFSGGEAAGIGLPLEAACGRLPSDPKRKDCSHNRWKCGTPISNPFEMGGIMWYKLWINYKQSWIYVGATSEMWSVPRG